jgi:DNA modification methylase
LGERVELNKIYNMDCIEGMKQIEDNSIDAIVTDPPYGLGFMGKEWDTYDKSQFGRKGEEGENDLKVKKNFNVLPRYLADNSFQEFTYEWSKEAYRILKPGGHLLSFGGSRTYHRMACAIEDAGFEIRDQIMWIYGSGFPKSLNVGKQLEKQGIINEEYNKIGTALKPAHEPIVVARKPLSEKSVAENVLKWGTGGINIDECRINFKDESDYNESVNKNQHKDFNSNNGIRVPTKGIYHGDFRPPENYNPVQGRFPANIIFDEEAGKLLDEQSGTVSQGHLGQSKVTGFGEFGNGKSEYFGVGRKDKTKSGASRFFYCAKASKSERNAGLEGFEEKIDCDRNPELNSANVPMDRSNNKKTNIHPTVKPIKLMEYLIKLVTPKNGIVLDPFMGSGTTAIACVKNNFKFIGFEKEAEYKEIADARIGKELQQKKLGD